MANLLDWLGGVGAQINPFDNGETYDSYMKKRQQPQPQTRPQTPQRQTPQAPQVGFNPASTLAPKPTVPRINQAQISQSSVANTTKPASELDRFNSMDVYGQRKRLNELQGLASRTQFNSQADVDNRNWAQQQINEIETNGKKKMGNPLTFVQDMGASMISPYKRTGEGIAEILHEVTGGAQRERDLRAQQDAQDIQLIRSYGNMIKNGNPQQQARARQALAKLNQQISLQNETNAARDAQLIDRVDPLKGAAAIGQIGLDVVTGGTLSQLAKGGVKAGVAANGNKLVNVFNQIVAPQGIKQGMRSGAGLGVTYGALGTAEQLGANATPQDYLTSMATGGLLGGALGGMVPAIGHVAKPVFNNFKATTKAQKLVNADNISAQFAHDASRQAVVNDPRIINATQNVQRFQQQAQELIGNGFSPNSPDVRKLTNDAQKWSGMRDDLAQKIYNDQYGKNFERGKQQATTQQRKQSLQDIKQATVEANKALRQELPIGNTLGGPLAKGYKDAQTAGRVFDGVDGKPRFEVDDSGARINNTDLSQGAFVGDLLDHPELYRNYPGLKDVPVEINPKLKGSAALDDRTGTIQINPKLTEQVQTVKPNLKNVTREDIYSYYESKGYERNELKAELDGLSVAQIAKQLPQEELNTIARVENPEYRTQLTKDAKGTLLHELQHEIQGVENFAKGGSPKSRSGKDMEAYRNLAGEAEARAVQARMNMPMSERYVKPEVDPSKAPEKWQGLIKDSREFTNPDDFVKSKQMDYHGTEQSFKRFSNSAIGSRGEPGFTGKGFYFTNRKNYAREYGKNVMEAHLNIKNPYVLDNAPGSFGVPYSPELIKERLKLPSDATPADITKKLKDMGHDGVVVNVIDASGRKKNGFEKMVIDAEDIWNPETLKALHEKTRPRSTFYDSLDVPKEDLIIRNDGGKAMSIDPTANKQNVNYAQRTVTAKTVDTERLKTDPTYQKQVQDSIFASGKPTDNELLKIYRKTVPPQKAVDNSSIDKRLVEAAKRERVVDFDPATNEDALKMFNVVNDDILKQIKSAKSYDDFVKQATKGLDPSSVNARMASIDRMAQSRIGMSVKDIYEMVSGRSGKAMSIDPTAALKQEATPKYMQDKATPEGYFTEGRYKDSAYPKNFVAKADIPHTNIKAGDRVALIKYRDGRFDAILSKKYKEKSTGYTISRESYVDPESFTQSQPPTPKNDPTAALKQEARKYKSADEFVESRGIPVYHRSPNKFNQFDISKVSNDSNRQNGGWGLYFSDAIPDSQYGSNLYEARLSKDSFIDSHNPVKENVVSKIVDAVKESGRNPSELNEFSYNGYLFYKTLSRILGGDKNASLFLSNNGIAGLKRSIGKNANDYILFNDASIKTKQQLTDLYNQAHSQPTPKVEATQPTVAPKGAPIEKTPQVGKPDPTANKQRLAKTQAMKQGTAVESQTQSKVPEKGNTASPKTSRGQQKVSSPSVVRLSDKSRTPLEVRGQNSKEIRSQIKSALNNSSAKERGFIETIINDPHTAQHIKDNVTSLYNVRNTKDLQIRAKNLVKDSPDLAQRVAEAGNGDVSVAVGSELLKHLQKNGNYETALDLADKLAKQGTEAGRTAQAFSIYGKLTPSGVLRFAQRTIKQYNDANNLAPGKQLKLTPQQAKSLTDKSTALWKMPEGRAKDIATKELVGEIYKLVPSSWAAKISTGQTMAQLLNPKTAIRNVLGNTLFGGVDNISQVLASGIDKATSKVRGSARTTALPSAKAQLGGLKSGAKQAIEEINKGVNLGPNTQFELGDVPTFRGGIMGGLEKTMSYELRVPDRAAYQAAFDDTVHGLMKANKLDKPTAEILEQANANGLYKTFQDNSTAAKLFVKLKEAFNHVGIEGKDGKRFGLGDLLLKYPKTPGNILARGLDYSPVGIVKGLTQIVKPAITGKPFNQHTFANSIARGTVGTGAIMGAGAVLGGLGIITEAPNEDTDARNLQKASGQGGYQINVDALRRYLFSGFDSDEAKLKEGDTLVSYDWAQPMSIPLSAGAAIGKKQNPGDAAISTVSNAANGLNTLIEQPLVSGLNTFFNNVKNKGVVGAAGETAKGAPASFVPTASNQTRQLTDNTTRSTYDPNGWVQSLNMVANKIPGASYLLHPQVDTLGNDKQNYQNGSNNLLNVAFNPAFVNKYQPDSAAKLPLGIMNDTGETKQIPTTTKTTQKVNGENMQLTAQQNEDFQRYVGLKTRDYLETASKDKQFMSLNQQDQATRISQAISNIQQAARVQVLGGNSDNADKNVKNILTTGAATLNTKAVSSGVSSVDINDKIASEYKDTLNKYSSDDDRTNWFNTENDAEYKYNLAKFENDKANGKISSAQEITKKRSLYKDKIGSNYSKDVRDLYNVNENDLAQWLSEDDGKTDKKKLADDIHAYDRALYDAGVIKSMKYKGGIGAKGRSGSGRKRSGSKKSSGTTAGKSLVSLTSQMNKVGVPKTDTEAKLPTSKKAVAKKAALKKYTVAKASVSKDTKIKTSKA